MVRSRLDRIATAAPITSAAVVMFAVCLAGCEPSAASQGPKQAPPVSVARALVGPQSLAVAGLGHVQGLDTAVVRAQTTGPILSVSFAEGQTVRQGQPLARIDPRPLQATVAQDEAALQRDLAALANARDSYTRSAPLVSQGLASAQQVEGYRSQISQMAATVQGDKAVIQRDRLTLASATIRAPIGGVIGVRQIDTGNLVSPTDTTGIATIAKVQPIAVTFALEQSQIVHLREAMDEAGAGGIEVDVLDQGEEHLLDRGRLTVIDNRIDPASGTVMLKAVFPNVRRLLWPGELVTARVVLRTIAQAITVPASAIQNNTNGTYVWIVSRNHRVAMRPVSIGARLGSRVIVSRGLIGGEVVVSDGQFGLTEGAAVRVTSGGSPSKPLKVDDPDRLGLQS